MRLASFDRVVEAGRVDVEDLVASVGQVARAGTVPKMRRAASTWCREAGTAPRAGADALLHVWSTAGLADRDLRMAVCLLAGPVSLESAEVLGMLIDQCSLDPDWRVQEMLAKALTWRCELAG